MKTMLSILCLFSLNMPITACDLDLCSKKLIPMWEEPTIHNILYRCINIKDAADAMMETFHDLWLQGFVSDDELEQIQLAYMRIIFNLGLPNSI